MERVLLVWVLHMETVALSMTSVGVQRLIVARDASRTLDLAHSKSMFTHNRLIFLFIHIIMGRVAGTKAISHLIITHII